MTDSTPVLSLIIPTYNERENIESILRATLDALQGIVAFEIVVVDDDSPDRTWEAVAEFEKRSPQVRLLRRTTGPRDQAHAIIDGFRSARGAILGKMDADGSHDPSAIPAMLALIEAGNEVAVGSRYAAGGEIVEWPLQRRILSNAGTAAVRALMKINLKDPLSGFWLIRREVFERAIDHEFAGGFKVLLQLCVHGGVTRAAEVPVKFRNRTKGKTKLRPLVMLRSGFTLLRLVAGTSSSNVNKG